MFKYESKMREPMPAGQSNREEESPPVPKIRPKEQKGKSAKELTLDELWGKLEEAKLNEPKPE